MLSPRELEQFTLQSRLTLCKGCGNHCRLTVSKFSGGHSHISGNRCENGLGKMITSPALPNLFAYKYKRVFQYTPLCEEDAPRGEIGIHALRGGSVVGDHTVMFVADEERIELTHRANSRESFAAGALRAALWLVNRKQGVYTMRHVLGFEPA